MDVAATEHLIMENAIAKLRRYSASEADVQRASTHFKNLQPGRCERMQNTTVEENKEAWLVLSAYLAI